MSADGALEAGRGWPNSITSCKLMFSVAKATSAIFLSEETLGEKLQLNQTTSVVVGFFSAYICTTRDFLASFYGFGITIFM